MNNLRVGEFLVMYSAGTGRDEHIQYESFTAKAAAFAFFKKLMRQKGVNRDTVTIYQQL